MRATFAVLSRSIHDGFHEASRGQGGIELRIIVGASGCLLQEWHHAGIGGKERVQLVLFLRRENFGRLGRLRVHRDKFLVHRLQIVGSPAQIRVGVLLRRNGLPGKIRDLYRASGLREALAAGVFQAVIPVLQTKTALSTRRIAIAATATIAVQLQDLLEAFHRKVSCVSAVS